MKPRKASIAQKTATLIESHSTLAILLAVLCLAFAVNFSFFGPGSDGGSGLGGTGKFGGESGLGGTGKTPDSGPSFKLGADDSEDRDNALDRDGVPGTGYRKHADDTDTFRTGEMLASLEDRFDVERLRLSLADPVPAPADRTPVVHEPDVAALVNAVDLDVNDNAISQMLAQEKATISNNALVSSLDVLDGLMLAEAETRMTLATGQAEEHGDVNTRSRVNMPVRPERPDRLSVPTRVTAVPRTAIPTPPPVRPMRTLSSLLNR